MYCPNCATPIDGVRFCRSCGANVSLIPQALSGELPGEGQKKGDGREGQMRSPSIDAWEKVYLGDPPRPREGQKPPPSIEKAVSSIFSGLGLFVAAFAALGFAPAGRIWWFWLLIPAFGSLGHGVGQYLRWREQTRPAVLPPSGVSHGFSSGMAPETGRLGGEPTAASALPGSVVESTTRHLDQPLRSGEEKSH